MINLFKSVIDCTVTIGILCTSGSQIHGNAGLFTGIGSNVITVPTAQGIRTGTTLQQVVTGSAL